jgi:2-phosphoglycerate kinase
MSKGKFMLHARLWSLETNRGSPMRFRVAGSGDCRRRGIDATLAAIRGSGARMGTGTKYLIGGAPTVGKSTVAAALAAHLNLPWISTDQIRDIMRTVANRGDHPKLFNPEGYDAERFYNAFSPEEIVGIEIGQGEAAWTGIRALIEHDYTWPQGFVVEGVNLLPHLIARDLPADANVRTVFVTEADPDRIRDVVFARGVWDDVNRTSDAAKEKELAWITRYDAWLRTEALAYGFPVVALDKDDRDLGRILEALKLS